MRIAYLITAYDQPEHLARLIAALDAPHAQFHVHVDGNAEIAPFEAAAAGRPNVHFTSPRIRVRWMGFSQVESILALLRQATAGGFDYCILLSGSDYPIKSNEFIRSFYSDATSEFIAFFALADRPSWQHKVQYLYPIDQMPIRGYSKSCEPSYWRRYFWGQFHKYLHLMPRRRFLSGLAPYAGSDWWSLTHACAEHILRFLDSNPGYTAFYRYTHCPSEMFFHTIILNSPWADRVHRVAEYRRWSAETPVGVKQLESALLPEELFNLRYIDWSGVTTGKREIPAVLEERDWEGIQNSPSLFARKFVPGRSDAILDLIDSRLRQ